MNLLFDGTAIPMTSAGGNKWTAEIPCVEIGDLAVSYTLAEGGVSQDFLIPIGGLTLVDPAGVVYDQVQFEAALAGGANPDQARAASAISGAKVRLQR